MGKLTKRRKYTSASIDTHSFRRNLERFGEEMEKLFRQMSSPSACFCALVLQRALSPIGGDRARRLGPLDDLERSIQYFLLMTCSTEPTARILNAIMRSY